MYPSKLTLTLLVALSIVLAGGAALAAAGGLPSRFRSAADTVVVSPQGSEEVPAPTPAPTATPSLPVKQESVLQVNIGPEGEPASPSKPEAKEPEGSESKQSQSSDVQVQGSSLGSVTGSSAVAEEIAAKGTVYTWHDGDREMRAVLQNDVPLSNGNERKATGGSSTVNGAVGVSKSKGGTYEEGQPIFRSESGGGEMTLPGGVIVLLDESWDEAEVTSFFSKNNISTSKLTKIAFLDNGYLVETEAGFPSLEQANSLAGQNGVVSSSPNWRQDRVAK